MDLTIVTVNYNSTALLKKMVESLPAGCGTLKYEVVIVDNRSHDTDEATLRKRFGQHRLILNPVNRGFAYGCNLGMKIARGRNIALVNPDVVLKPGCLELLSRYMDAHAEVGAVGPQLLNGDGSVQISCRRIPDLFSLFSESSGLAAMFPKNRWFGRYRMSDWPHNEEREVEQLMGACLVLRKNLADALGMFDEAYFMYFEEVDLCKRILERGYKIKFLPQAQAIHFRGESALTDKGNALSAFYQSRSYYFRKHHGRLSSMAVDLLSLLDAGLRSGYWSARARIRPEDPKAKTFADGYTQAARTILSLSRPERQA